MRQDLATLDIGRAAAYVAGTDYDYAQATERAAESWRSLHRNGFELGLFLLAIKAREEPGRYLGALGQIGIPRRTASRFAGRTAMLLKNNNGPALAHLTGEQIEQLQKLERFNPERFTDVLEAQPGTIAGTPIEDAAKLTTHEFKKLLRGEIQRPPKDPVTEAFRAWWNLGFDGRETFFALIVQRHLDEKHNYRVTRR